MAELAPVLEQQLSLVLARRDFMEPPARSVNNYLFWFYSQKLSLFILYLYSNVK
jgi:hypothetical protein